MRLFRFNFFRLVVVSLMLVSHFSLLDSHLAFAAHRYHTSLTRIDYNEKEQTAQITIQTYADDLEKALTAKTGSRVNIEKTKDLEKIALAYFADSFVLRNKAGEIKSLRWIGFERQTDGIYLYLEAEMPEGFEASTLENRFLFDCFEDQINLVTVHAAGKKHDSVFKTGDKSQKLFGDLPSNQ